MSTFFDLDSIWRDGEANLNPANYELTPAQVETWFPSARSVRAHPQNPSMKPLEFATSIKIHYLTIPYTESFAELPRIYINFRSKEYGDIHLIQAISGKQPDAKFICVFDRIQNDRNGTPLWIHWRCSMEQVMRFKRGDTIIFQITTRDGTILPIEDNPIPDPPDPLRQTLCTLEALPYIKDGDYDNHMVETMQT